MARRLSRGRLFTLNQQGQNSGMAVDPGIRDSLITSTVIRDGHLITTEITLDLGSTVDPISSMGTADLVLGVSSSSGTHVSSSLGKITEAVNGVITEAECICLEVPTGTGVRKDIDFVASTSIGVGFSGSLSSVTSLATAGGDWVKGKNIITDLDANATDDKFIYLTLGSATDGVQSRVYTGGKYVLRLYGYAAPADAP
tara:strand:+ start:558 stop:1154 length:597 start_codon:yes stop_codon:yes gene_type:complete